MGRYDFLEDEKTRKKLEERQEKIITQKKQEEVRESRSEDTEEEEEGGPRVYTKQSGQIGGVIYPGEKSEKAAEKPSEQIMGRKESKKKSQKGNPGEEDLPIKLHHTEKTKVGTENRPSPPKETEKEESGNLGEKENEGQAEEARDEIWQ